jgi:hypothetical protein
MKNNVLLLHTCIIMLMALQLPAQVSFGIRGGLLNTGFTYEDLDELNNDTISADFDNYRGVLFGAVVDYQITKNFGFQTGVDYARRGDIVRLSGNFLGFQFESENTTIINYMEVPVLAKFGAPLGPVRVDLLAGTSFGYAVSGKSKFLDTFGGNSEEEEFDLFGEDEDAIKRTNITGQIGAVVTIPLGKASVFADGRYFHGFTDLSTVEDAEAEPLTNRGVGFSVGILFKL